MGKVLVMGNGAAADWNTEVRVRVRVRVIIRLTISQPFS